MLCALKSEGVLRASELAEITGVARNTASEHLAKLSHGGLVRYESDGRNRYYRLAGPEVADALEALEYLSVAVAPADRLIPGIDGRLKFVRLCYDHIGGRLAVNIAQVLLERGDLTVDKGRFVLTTTGEMTFSEFGIDVSKLRSGRRMLVRSCPDWTESEHHLGGAIGAALFGRFRELGWLVASRKSLDVKLTETGREKICHHFGDVIRIAT